VDWSGRLSSAGVQRLQFESEVTREEFDGFLRGPGAAHFVGHPAVPAVAGGARPDPVRAVGIRELEAETEVATATVALTLREERRPSGDAPGDARGRGAPLAEAEAVVRSMSLAMHGDRAVVLPLLQLRRFDEYTPRTP